MFTVSNALLMFSATVTVHSGGLFRQKPVAMVLSMPCSAYRAVAPEVMLCRYVWYDDLDAWGSANAHVSAWPWNWYDSCQFQCLMDDVVA